MNLIYLYYTEWMIVIRQGFQNNIEFTGFKPLHRENMRSILGNNMVKKDVVSM
jgi:hypothetical protein